MPLYCTCSVSQRCKKTRAILPFGGRFVAEIFVQNFKWRVSQRGADVSYILIQLLLLYLKNLLSYTAWHNYFQAFFAVQILPIRVCTPILYTWHLWGTSLSSLLWTKPGQTLEFLLLPLCHWISLWGTLFYCCKYPTTYAYASTMPL